MAKRGRKKAPPPPVRVPHEKHVEALVNEHTFAKAKADSVMAPIKALIKAAKKNAGLDTKAFDLRKHLAALEPEKANRRAEMIVLALYRGGYLNGRDLLSSFPSAEVGVWASEVEKQFRRTDEEGRDEGLEDSPVFDGTKAGADADKIDTAPAPDAPAEEPFDEGGDEAKRRAEITAREIEAEDEFSRHRRRKVLGDRAGTHTAGPLN